MTSEAAQIYRGAEKIGAVMSDAPGEIMIDGLQTNGADLMIINMAAPEATVKACAALAHNLGIDSIYEVVVSGREAGNEPVD